MYLSTWWLILGLFVLVAIIYFGRWLYLRSVRMRNRLQMERIYANITHELLTPLTIISASVEHLRSEEPKYGYDYDMMQLNIQRMVKLLQQILETSKSQSGELKLMVSHGDVMKYIRETAVKLLGRFPWLSKSQSDLEMRIADHWRLRRLRRVEARNRRIFYLEIAVF